MNRVITAVPCLLLKLFIKECSSFVLPNHQVKQVLFPTVGNVLKFLVLKKNSCFFGFLGQEQEAVFCFKLVPHKAKIAFGMLKLIVQ